MLRWYRPDLVHEVTLRTIDGRWWFDAGNPTMRSEILGALAAAQRRTGVRIHAFTVMSNHYHALYSFDHPEQFAAFLCHFHAALARIANRYWQRRGRVWDGRAVVIPVAGDPESQLQRLEYLLGQNVKTGAGAHPRDWPGACATPWLLEGTPLVGSHRDQTAIALASRNGHDAGDVANYCEDVTVAMTPLPCFAGRPDHEWREQVRELADAVAERHGAVPTEAGACDRECSQATNRVDAGRFGDVPSELSEQAEQARTSASPQTRAVKLAHAAHTADRLKLAEDRRKFEQEFRDCARQLLAESRLAAQGKLARLVEFPAWSFPPRQPSCPRWSNREAKPYNFSE
ncbi:MAG: hypothetical protein HY902_21125 [Deltaproteobacteria bacterium]|nr:hypothetical protein [Deltaproteobacteria bacterium]